LKYNSTWKSILNKLEIEENEHKAFLVAHAQAFEALAIHLTKKKDELGKKIYAKSNYDNPNWNLRQADYSGSYRELVELINLLED